MKIGAATRKFEAWLGQVVRLVPADLAYKHGQMKADPFLFFRATYYRWCQLWIREHRKLARAAETWTVGDLHLENFGTWRDAEGRLVWGVNDFDEASPMAFANDLARLAVSAFLAADSNPAFALKRNAICQEILLGYGENLQAGGAPFILMEKHPALRAMAVQDLRQPPLFWAALLARTKPVGEKKIPSSVRKALRSISPPVDLDLRVEREPKGLGSLGRPRFLALGTWEGGLLAREAKAVAPSALLWARGRPASPGNPFLEKTVRAAVRCQDPYYQTHRNWLVRRLAPDCSRIDMAELSHHHDRALLLRGMGAETANIHLGRKKAGRQILKDLQQLPARWLLHAATDLHDRCLADWEKFQKEDL